ncbi:MAG: TonB-dependent receptor plug domain-containing protein, partial [Gemmatimonadales bacterium]
DMQYRTPLGTRNDLVTGAAYRFDRETFDGHVGFSLTPATSDISLVTAFLQDEVSLFDKRLAVTRGSQVQYDSDAGGGIQPTARAMWNAMPRQRLWAAVSRALRTPSLEGRGIRVDFPPTAGPGGLPLFLTTVGNPSAETETLFETDAGYRLEIGRVASIDVAGFVGRYGRLRTTEVTDTVVEFAPAPQVVVASQFGGLLDATTRGLEVSGQWTPVPAWRLDGSYSAFHITPRLDPASRDATSAGTDASTPQAQWQLRSTVSPGTRATLTAAIFHEGALAQAQVAAYTRADLNAEWRFTPHLSVMAIGQNLLDAAHAEFTSATALVLATQVSRSGSLRLRWTF